MGAREELRWEVGSDQIDPDRWAQAILTALAGGKNEKRVTRWGIWPAVLLIILLSVALSALTGSWVVLVAFLPVVLLVAGIFALSRASARRLANQIRSAPSALEPFVFTANAAGTHSTSRSGSDQLAWERYRDVMRDNELLLLTLDNKAVRVLPVAALSSGQSPDAAAAQLRDWIDAARLGPRAALTTDDGGASDPSVGGGT